MRREPFSNTPLRARAGTGHLLLFAYAIRFLNHEADKELYKIFVEEYEIPLNMKSADFWTVVLGQRIILA